jgi:hypothetical protein
MTFPNPPVATVRVGRITQREVTRAIGQTLDRNFAPGGRLVTAGDGNMVSVDYMGHPRQAPQWSQEQGTNAGSQYRSRRRGRSHVCTHARSRAAAYTSRGRDYVPG